MTIGRLPNETPAYAALRDELQQAEIALRDQRERVAELRRKLPLDTVIQDHVFAELCDGAQVEVRLSDLFEAPNKPLVLMHFMFGKKQDKLCPMCTAWADGYDGVVHHLRQHVNFAVLVAGDVGAFEGYARSRGWRGLRLLSAADSTLKAELGFETADGAQHPGVSVFKLSDGGNIVHFYSQSAWLGGSEFRGMDLLSPIWHYLDLTPAGRGDWYPSREYDSE